MLTEGWKHDYDIGCGSDDGRNDVIDKYMEPDCQREDVDDDDIVNVIITKMMMLLM